MKLEAIISGLESDEIGLEESFKAYEQGMELVRKCSQTIDTVEKKVQKINADGKLEEFE